MKFFSLEHFEAIVFAALLAVPLFSSHPEGRLVGLCILCYGVAITGIRCKELEKKLSEKEKS